MGEVHDVVMAEAKVEEISDTAAVAVAQPLSDVQPPTHPSPSPRKRVPKPKAPKYVQPAYFYPTYDVTRPTGNQDIVALDPTIELSPVDDPGAARGIPVFKPSMEEFADFEGYMNKVDHWGRYSGIVKVIPPDEWTQQVPPIEKRTLQNLRIKNPIQQNMMGRAGLFRQNNIEKSKSKPLSIEDWFTKCQHSSFRAPGPKEGDKAVARDSAEALAERKKYKEQKLAAAKAKKEERDAKALAKAAKAREDALVEDKVLNPGTPASVVSVEPAASEHSSGVTNGDDLPLLGTPPATEADLPVPSSTGKPRGRSTKSKPEQDPDEPLQPFYAEFEPRATWLSEGTKAEDWTPEACRDIERRYWKNVGIGEPSWYGADLKGSLFRDPETPWNVAHLPNLLNRLSITKQLPGVNTPYLYFGMWRAAFSWHVEDMDLFSINYIHFGAPKHWYAIPQAKAEAFERTLAGYFPGDAKRCDQFLRHKSFTVSPMRLANDNIKPNVMVQHQNEFVITYPRGYHAGFNMGFNCAESINFALDSWVELGRRAKICECEEDSVRIDVEALITENELVDAFQQERAGKMGPGTPSQVNQRAESENGSQRKRKPSKKALGDDDEGPPAKVRMISKDTEPERKPKAAKQIEIPVSRPCLFCPSLTTDDLLPVYNPSAMVILQSRSFEKENCGVFAHETCARAIPEAYMHDYTIGERTIQCVLGAENIPRDRWNLKCSCCTGKVSLTGAKIQCTKGKCSRAFHVSCAIADSEISFKEVEVETWEQLPPDSGAPAWAKPKCQLVKTIQVELLCSQHNPMVKDAKKRQATEALFRQVTSLPIGSRVKIRASGGVFEVTLLETVPLTKKVKVLWDDKRQTDVDWSQLDLKPVVEYKLLTNEYERPKAVSFRTKPTAETAVEVESEVPRLQLPQHQLLVKQHPSYEAPDPLAYRRFLPPAGETYTPTPTQYSSNQYQQQSSQPYAPFLHVPAHSAPAQYYPPPQPVAPHRQSYDPSYSIGSHHAHAPQYAPYQPSPYTYQSYGSQGSAPPHPRYNSHGTRDQQPPRQHQGTWYPPAQPYHPPTQTHSLSNSHSQPPSHHQARSYEPKLQPGAHVQERPSYEQNRNAPPIAPYHPPDVSLPYQPPTPQPLGSSQIDFNKVLITPELIAMLDRNKVMKQALTDIKRAQDTSSVSYV